MVFSQPLLCAFSALYLIHVSDTLFWTWEAIHSIYFIRPGLYSHHMNWIEIKLWIFPFFVFDPLQRYPFDWKTPHTYLIAYIPQCMGNVRIFHISHFHEIFVDYNHLRIYNQVFIGVVFAQFLNLTFGSCWLFMFIADDLGKDLTDFNIVTHTSNANDAKLMEKFCDLVKIYTDAKQ